MKKLFLALSAFTMSLVSIMAQNTLPNIEGKQIYIPKDLRNNNFASDTAQWSTSRMALTPNFVIFWEKGFGNDLSCPPDLEGHKMSVNLSNLKDKLESFYAFYKDSLKFVLPGSKSEKYRMMAMLNYSLEGTAYGGDYDETIGALWLAPNRLQDTKLNCIAHEIGHSFQSQIGSDGTGESWGGGGIFEMTSQWMLWQVNPQWVTDENYHWEGFKQKIHLPFLAIDNIYHSPYVLEYWSDKHGLSIMADLFRAGKRGEDPAQTYMRMFNLSYDAFASELLDCYSRLITFDYKRIHNECMPYINQLSSPTITSPTGYVMPSSTHVPQQYGFNVIPLKCKSNIKVKFCGMGDARKDGYTYRIVCTDDAGNATYSTPSSDINGKVSMKMPKGATHAYLVVVGYPKDTYQMARNPYARRNRGQKPAEPRKFPYSFIQK